MIQNEIIAVGLLKNGPEKDLYDSYNKRLNTPIKLIEIDPRKNTDRKSWQNALLPHLNASKSYKIFLDETGKNLTSQALAEKLETLTLHGNSTFSFIIGGADGFDKNFIKNHADFKLSLSAMTFPHIMARVFLVEQLYRAQQIIANHPYHRT